MRDKNIKYWLFGTLVCLIGLTGARPLLAGCVCDSEQKVHFNLNGIAIVAGTATVTITYGDTSQTFTITGGTVALNPSTGKYVATSFECVSWPAEITVKPKLDQVVRIKYDWNCDDTSPGYTEFEGDIGLNPITYWSRPSSRCLKVWVNQNNGNWILEPLILSGTFGCQSGAGSIVYGIKGVMATDDSNVGDSTGPQAGGGQPQANIAELTDPPPTGASCSGSSFAPQSAQLSNTNSGQTQLRGSALAPAPFISLTNQTVTTNTYGASQQPVNAAQGVSQDTSGNGYSVSDLVGRLRWEMSLGSVSRTLTLGKLVYQADVLDSTAYSTARLSLADGSDPELIITDGSGYLRQILLLQNNGSGSVQTLVDIVTISHGFKVDVYPGAQIGAFNGTVYGTSGSPSLTWKVENPDATPVGRVKFTKTDGPDTEVHLAEWTGTAGTAGTMTIYRYNDKWKEVRGYSLNTSPNQRIETISLYKNDVLQHKSQETYQEFYNWGNPGDVFEAMVQQVEDPDGKALTTTYGYYDNAGDPGNLLGQVTYPDGYVDQTPNRFIGNDLAPALPNGSPEQMQQPFLDALSQLEEDVNYQVGGPAYTYDLDVWTWNYAAGEAVGYQEKIYMFRNGVWDTQTYNLADDFGEYTFADEQVDIGSRKPFFTQDAQGRTRDLYYVVGTWDPVTDTFNPGAGDTAVKTITINGVASATQGLANKTTVDVTVEDEFGRVLLEESRVNTNPDGIENDIQVNGITALASDVANMPLINQTVNTYTDGRLAQTERNGVVVYQAGYYPNGKLEWVKDESGQETDYTYDEMLWVYQKTVLGRGGDPDQTTTYEYDVLGNVSSETRAAGGLTAEKQWTYDLAGELASTTDMDGLTTQTANDYSAGYKVVTETLPTQATRITSYYKDRQVRSITGTAVEDEYLVPDLVQWSYTSYPYREATWVYRDSGLTQLKSLRVTDWVGNEILFKTPQFQGAGYRYRFTYYDDDGSDYTRQLPVEIDETGRAIQLSTYDNLGRLATQGFDLNADGVLNPVSSEPITTFDRSFAFNSTDNDWEDVNTVQRYLQNNSDTQTLFQQTRTRVPAALSGDEISHTSTGLAGGGTTVSTVSLQTTGDHAGEYTSTVNDQEHNQVWASVQRDGRLRSETQPGITTPRTYTYTAFGETATVSDPVTGNLTYAYDPTTRRLSSVTDSLTRETDYSYYPAVSANAGRIKGTRDAAGNWTYFDYFPAGQIYRQWGVNNYPVQYQYNEAGNMTQMKTFRTAPGTVDWSSSTWPNPPGGDITQWNYDDAHSGLLQSKVYPNGGSGQKTVSYTYNSGNFLLTKVNGRLQTITYGFDTLEQLKTLTYSDGTPSATLDYDRAGRLDSVVDAAGTHSVSWTDRDQMEDENYTAGLLSGASVNRVYDSEFRLNRIELAQAGVTQTRERFVYDPISWLDYAVEENADGSAELRRYDYTFQAGRPFVGSVADSEASSPVMTQNYNHDSLGRLSGASAVLAGGPTAYGVNYQFDPNYNRRSEADLADGTKWNYGYNNRSEVTSGKRQLASSAMAGGEQFEYTFDDIGNRTQTKAGGDAAGNNLRSASYSANALNQLTQRDVPGSLWLVGDAPGTLTLLGAVEGQAFTVQRQENGRFFGEAPVNNASDPVFARVTVAAKNGSTLADFHTGNKFVARTPENFAYDDDGNLTSDGQWTYTWDAENRLKRMVSATSVGPQQRMDFGYDWMGRRISKTVWNNTTGTGTPALDERLVYDGWNLLAELNTSHSALRTYMWGLDLSGTMQGAGGVGGLLSMTVHGGPQAGPYYYGYDGNGNVMGVVKADGTTSAQYEYGPFGEVIRATGPMADTNPFRFSTKYEDDENDLLYYGGRYYDPSTGRWPNHDPIGESITRNLYGFVDNDGINFFDLDGLEKGAELLMRHNGSAFGDTPINPINGLQLLVGLPFSVLSGDIFHSDIQKISKDTCNVLITVNGIFTKRKQANDMLADLLANSPRYAGLKLGIAAGNRSTYGGDILQIIGDEFGAIQSASFDLARQINQTYDAYKRNGCCCGSIQVFAHSQGTKVFQRAQSLIKPEARKMICYTGIGGETRISPNGLANAENNRNIYDPVPYGQFLNPVNLATQPFIDTNTRDASGHGYFSSYADWAHQLKPNCPCTSISTK